MTTKTKVCLQNHPKISDLIFSCLTPRVKVCIHLENLIFVSKCNDFSLTTGGQCKDRRTGGQCKDLRTGSQCKDLRTGSQCKDLRTGKRAKLFNNLVKLTP